MPKGSRAPSTREGETSSTVPGRGLSLVGGGASPQRALHLTQTHARAESLLG